MLIGCDKLELAESAGVAKMSSSDLHIIAPFLFWRKNLILTGKAYRREKESDITLGL